MARRTTRPATAARRNPSEGTDTLVSYRQKRHFDVTSEPGGGRAKTKKARGCSFVIQEHHASHLHYDFRLEVDGVLKSWAVPKVPVMDAAAKRLAVQVEDHPLEYATFHGDIPAGQYGAGHVEIWDSGTYDNLMARKHPPLDMPASLEAGHVEVALHGKRLRGAFALVRMKGHDKKQNWLLIKMREDDAAAPASPEAAMPRHRTRSAHAAAATDALPDAAPPAIRSNGTPQMPTFTHTSKIIFPELGITKQHVLDYYTTVGRLLLPHLRDRPITLERLPDGLTEHGPRFWQKNTPAHYPAWIPRVNLPDEHGKPVDYALVNNLETLLYLVNQGAITFHVFMSRVHSLQQPDYVLFDLDLGSAPFAHAVQAATALHAFLQERQIPCYLKTSGKTGLHVLAVPPERDSYDTARAWAVDVGHQLLRKMPDLLTMERSKEKREGRMYLDVMQNVMGRHVVPPYVVRPVPRATVSMPLHWHDLTPRLKPQRFTLPHAENIFEAHPVDPLAALASPAA